MIDHTTTSTKTATKREQERSTRPIRSLSPAQVRHRLNASTGYLMLGMYDHALQELRPFSLRGSADVARLRGEIYREQDRHHEALTQFDIALDAQPDDLTASIGKAWSLKRLGCLNGAIDTLREAAEHHPREALVQYNLACYFALSGEKAECLSHLGVALRLAPAYVELIDDEPDFKPLRDDADFERMVSLVERVA